MQLTECAPLATGRRLSCERTRERLESGEADRPLSDGRLIGRLVEQFQEGFSLLDADGTLLDVNPAMCDMVGYDREELIGAGVPHPYWPPEDLERIARDLQCCLAGDARARELLFVRKSGERFPVLLTPSVIRDEAGEPICVLALIRDVSAQHDQELALRTSEARYARAQEVGRVGSWEYDPQTARFWGSAEARRIFGLDPDTPSFSTEDVEATTPEREMVHQALVDLIEKGKRFELEYEIVPTQSTESRWIWSVAEAERDEQGRVVLVTGVIQDFTERHRSEEALHESEARYRSVVENAPVGMFQATLGGRLLYVNPDCARTFGFAAPAEMIAFVNRAGIAEALFEDPSSREQLLRDVHAAAGEWTAAKSRMRHRDGSIHVDLVYRSERRDLVSGEIDLFGFVRDVTVQEQADKAVQRSAYLLSQGESLAHLGSWEWDVAAGTSTVSKEWQRIHGLAGDHVSDEEVLALCHDDDREKLRRAWEEAAAGSLYRVEHRIIHPVTREVRHLRAYGEPVCDAEGRVRSRVRCVARRHRTRARGRGPHGARGASATSSGHDRRGARRHGSDARPLHCAA